MTRRKRRAGGERGGEEVEIGGSRSLKNKQINKSTNQHINEQKKSERKEG